MNEQIMYIKNINILRRVIQLVSVNIKETNLEFGPLEDRKETNLIVVHHVGGTDRDVSAEEIHGWHLANGWSGIGYHYVIRKDGTIERGRPREMIGAHAEGFNSRSIGINIVGDFEQATPEPAQIESAAMLIAELCEIYCLCPDAQTIVGHRDLMSTDCPGENLYCLLQDIRGKAVWYQQNC
ncbi:MAG: N-acetylmuramoyl-L-alanine amidase [Veillonellales bacterium]